MSETQLSEKTIKIPSENYTAARASSGSMSRHNGDAVAMATQGATLEEVYGLAKEALDTPVKDLQEKYGHLNVGQQRMNLGNRLRGVMNKINRNNEAEAKKEDGKVGISGEQYIAEIAVDVRAAVDARTEADAKTKAEKAEAAAKAKAGKAAEKADAKTAKAK